jgi:peptidoglycan/LPS O-acetylase OafA/YrhL
MATERIHQIDVLRGCAALWVVLSHYQPYWNQYFAPTLVIVPNSVGVYAVYLFFVISGFVIFMTLDRCRTVLDFAVMRFSRLYPAYWVVLALSTVAGVALFGDTLWPGGVITNATMFQEFVGVPNHDNVFWSLSVEMAFYLNVAWLFALGLHKSPKRVVTLWLLAAFVWAVAFKDPGAEHRQTLALLFALDFAPYFSIGIVFFDAMKWGWSQRRRAVIAFALVTQGLIGGWVAFLIAVAITAIVWLALSGRLSFLVGRVMLWLGAISYALYLSHRNLGYHLLDWLHTQNVDGMLATPVVIAFALTLATLITYVVERPALRAIRSWYDARGVSGFQLAR